MQNREKKQQERKSVKKMLIYFLSSKNRKSYAGCCKMSDNAQYTLLYVEPGV